MEKTGCSFVTEKGKTICSVEEEPRWIPENYFKLHIELLNHALSKDEIFPEITEFFKLQLEIAKHLLNYSHIENQGVGANLIAIAKLTRNLGSYTLFPWGPSDHQVYIDIHHQHEGEFNLTIFDLGAGRIGEPAVRRNYQPIEYRALSRADLFQHVKQRAKLTPRQRPKLTPLSRLN